MKTNILNSETTKETVREFNSFLNFNNYIVETKEDLEKYFRMFLTKSFSYNFFNNEDFKNNSIRTIKRHL